jgi:phospholipid-binding lipoprotein MlaA
MIYRFLPTIFMLCMILNLLPAFNLDMAVAGAADSANANAESAVTEGNAGITDINATDAMSDLDELDELDDWSDDNDTSVTVFDPIEPVNRAVFYINDKLYFYGIKPVAEGYAWLLPKVVRESIANFFYNVFTPIRVANCMLQLNFRGTETELARFIINSTVGVLGFMDPAYDRWNMSRVYEDFGQTLGVYGVDFGPYILIPFLGPSSPRDAIGMFVDSYFNPVNYYLTSFVSQAAIRGSWTINERSLQLGEYEALKESSLDPYVALRSAYYQFRENQVNDQPRIFGSFMAK